MKKHWYYLVFIFICFSCSEESLETKQDYEERLTLLYQEMESIVAEGSCAKPTECDFIPVGDKACGGPSGYIIFSEDINLEKLEEIADEYTNLERTYNQKFGIPSDCSLTRPPQNIGCINNACGEIMNE